MHWKLIGRGDKLELNVTVPAHVVAEVQLPLLSLMPRSISVQSENESGRGAIIINNCHIRCGVDLRAEWSAGGCGHLSGMRCQQRLDGEYALWLVVGSGRYRFISSAEDIFKDMAF